MVSRRVVDEAKRTDGTETLSETDARDSRTE